MFISSLPLTLDPIPLLWEREESFQPHGNALRIAWGPKCKFLVQSLIPSVPGHKCIVVWKLGFSDPHLGGFPSSSLLHQLTSMLLAHQDLVVGVEWGLWGRRWHKSYTEDMEAYPPQSDTRSSEPQFPILTLHSHFVLWGLYWALVWEPWHSARDSPDSVSPPTLQFPRQEGPSSSPLGGLEITPCPAVWGWHRVIMSTRLRLCPLFAPPHLIQKKNNTKPQINYKE